MAKIPCYVKKLFRKRLFPFISFYIQGSLRISTRTEALIDTGSPFTVLSTTEALKLNLHITSWRRGETVHLAGFKFFMHPLKNMDFFFKNEKGEVVKFPMDIGVLVPTKKGKKILDKVKYIPNIIGNDFLEEHKLALYHNPSKREAYLEQV